VEKKGQESLEGNREKKKEKIAKPVVSQQDLSYRVQNVADSDRKTVRTKGTEKHRRELNKKLGLDRLQLSEMEGPTKKKVVLAGGTIK